MSDPEIMQMWKDQPSRRTVPSSEEIERRAVAARARSRREGAIAGTAAVTNLGLHIAATMYPDAHVPLRLAEFACWIVFLIYLRPHVSGHPLIIGLGLHSKAETCIDFYGKELAVQLRRYRGYRGGSALFGALGLTSFLIALYVPSKDPFPLSMLGGALWIAAAMFAWQGWHQAPTLQREIEEFRNWKTEHH